MRDLVLAIRADEACHQESNHFFGEVDKSMDIEEEKIRIYHDKNEARLKNSVWLLLHFICFNILIIRVYNTFQML